MPLDASSSLDPECVSAPESVVDLSEVVRRHAARVWRTLKYLGVHDADVADASQEVFLIVHRRLPEFRGDSRLETWLYGICLGVARNVRRKQLRAARDVVELELDLLEPTQEREIDLSRARAALRDALARIPPEQREVFVLHEIEDLGMRAIAGAVGCPLFTAYSRLRLARKNLARLLEPQGSHPR